MKTLLEPFQVLIKSFYCTNIGIWFRHKVFNNWPEIEPWVKAAIKNLPMAKAYKVYWDNHIVKNPQIEAESSAHDIVNLRPYLKIFIRFKKKDNLFSAFLCSIDYKSKIFIAYKDVIFYRLITYQSFLALTISSTLAYYFKTIT